MNRLNTNNLNNAARASTVESTVEPTAAISHRRRVSILDVLMLTLALNLIPFGMMQTAHADAIGTGDYLAWQEREQRAERVDAFLAQDNVQAQMVALGVDPEDAARRVSALTDEELRLLDQQIAEMPAGGDALAVIGVVFVVLLILELVGVTNVFNTI